MPNNKYVGLFGIDYRYKVAVYNGWSIFKWNTMVHRENTSSFPTSSSSSWKIIIFRYIRQFELMAYECAHCRSSMSSIFLILSFTFLCIFHSSSVGVVFVVVVLTAACVSLFFFFFWLLHSSSIDSTIVATSVLTMSVKCSIQITTWLSRNSPYSNT